MPVIATLGAASVRGFSGFYKTTAISGNNWIAKAGQYLNETTFDGTDSLYSIGTSGLVIKTASDGSATWKETITTGGLAITFTKIKTVSPTQIYVTGYYFSSSNIPLFFVLNSDGSVASARSITTRGKFDGLTSSSSGIVYSSGYMNTISGGSTSRSHYFIISNGSVVTKRYYGSSSELNSNFIGYGSSDSAYIANSNSPLLVKISSSFLVFWRALSSSVIPVACVESNNNLYVVGQYTVGSLFLVVKLNALTGAFVWARTLSSTSDALCVAVDNFSNVYIGGTTGFDGVIIKVDSSGNLVWQRRVSIGVLSQIKSISVDAATDTIYALCSPTSTSNNYSFILSLPTNGSLTGTYSVGGTSVTYSSTSETLNTVTPTFTSPSFSFSTSNLLDASRATVVDAATPSYDLITVP
jgi:hypothetical protein